MNPSWTALLYTTVLRGHLPELRIVVVDLTVALLHCILRVRAVARTKLRIVDYSAFAGGDNAAAAAAAAAGGGRFWSNL